MINDAEQSGMFSKQFQIRKREAAWTLQVSTLFYNDTKQWKPSNHWRKYFCNYHISYSITIQTWWRLCIWICKRLFNLNYKVIRCKLLSHFRSPQPYTPERNLAILYFIKNKCIQIVCYSVAPVRELDLNGEDESANDDQNIPYTIVLVVDAEYSTWQFWCERWWGE